MGQDDMRGIIEQTKGQVTEKAKNVTQIISAEHDEAFIKQRVKQMLSYDMSTAKENLSRELQDLLKEAKQLEMANSKGKYINAVISEGRLPLPILNKI